VILFNCVFKKIRVVLTFAVCAALPVDLVNVIRAAARDYNLALFKSTSNTQHLF